VTVTIKQQEVKPVELSRTSPSTDTMNIEEIY